MESRGLRKRQPPAAPKELSPVKRRRQQAPRKEAQPAKEVQQEEEDESSQDHESEEIQVKPKADVWQRPKVANPRRAAPAPSQAGSMASVTFVRDQDEYQQGEEEEEDDDDDSPHDGAHSEESKREVMRLYIADLSDTAVDLITRLQRVGRESDTFRLYLKPKRAAFLAMRDAYDDLQVSGYAPFIDGIEGAGLKDKDEDVIEISRAIGYANLASALDMIDGILTDTVDVNDTLEHISVLDDFLHKVFTPFGDEAENSKIALNLRTLRAILSMPQNLKSKAEAYHVFVSSFCQLDETIDRPDYAKFMVNGPFKELSHSESEDLVTVCSRRLSDIVSEVKKEKKVPRFQRLWEDYSIGGVLEELKSWIFRVYDVSKRQQRPASRVSATAASHDAFHDASENVEASEESQSVGESQPVLRIEDAKQATLFQGQASFRDLQSSKPRDSIPPSNQQQAGPASGGPTDYDHGNVDLLGSRPPTLRGASPSMAAPAGPSSRQRQDSNGENDDDDDDDDEESLFETDTRPTDRNKQIAIANHLRRAAESPPPRVSHTAPSSSMRPPPVPRTRYPSPPPGAYPSLSAAPPPSSFAAIQAEKRFLSLEVRHTARPAMPKQRQAWSDDDTDTLLGLIHRRQAAWSHIERYDNQLFEHPRNQQAYRDKARNMKVDLLLTDAVLPPCFDLVTLGKKEADRLISFGKNPNRREGDIDENGQAINTEYAGDLL